MSEVGVPETPQDITAAQIDGWLKQLERDIQTESGRFFKQTIMPKIIFQEIAHRIRTMRQMANVLKAARAELVETRALADAAKVWACGARVRARLYC